MAASVFTLRVCNRLRKKQLLNLTVAEANNMKNKKLAPTPLKAGVAKCGKAPYEKPVLRIFGRVAELTRGGGGSGADSKKSSNANPNHGVWG